MFKPSKNLLGSLRRIGALPFGRTAVLVLLVPLGAMAGVTNTDIPVAPQPGASVKVSAAGGYQIRCWQYGHLMFEESHVALPPADGPESRVKLAAMDRRGQPMYLAETGNATCLIRKPVEERTWPK